MKACPVCGKAFDPKLSYAGTRFTGQSRKWCSPHCRDVGHYQRLRNRGYYRDHHTERLTQARIRYDQYIAIRQRRKERHNAQKEGA